MLHSIKLTTYAQKRRYEGAEARAENNNSTEFEKLEFILPIRLPDEAFRGILNFWKFFEMESKLKAVSYYPFTILEIISISKCKMFSFSMILQDDMFVGLPDLDCD